MTRSLLPLAALAGMVAGIGNVHAQNLPPFFDGAGIAYSPQIRIANSGIVNDVQAWVSADRKYVTLGARNQQASTILREFAFTRPAGNLGFIGSAIPAQDPADRNSPAVPATVLNHVGVQRLDELGATQSANGANNVRK